MLDCGSFYKALKAHGVNFFTGVPDSLLKSICAYITDESLPQEHVITPNEGNAIALATGYHLGTGGVPLVYMQNSGLGNAVNPLTSLADPEVYGIPMVLLIGWRGEPDVPDEPQHTKMGRITPALLDTLGVPYIILPTDWEAANSAVESAIKQARSQNRPVALLVREGTFAPYNLQGRLKTVQNGLSREAAIIHIARDLPKDALVVSTTGKISRELYEFRESTGAGHHQDFLVVGAMGHTAQITLGLALAQPKRPIYCFDGDGSVLMHMGALSIIGTSQCENFHHVVLNNWAHESVGGQPTVAGQIDIPAIANACGYRQVNQAQKLEELERLKPQLFQTGPSLLEILVEPGARPNLGRPRERPIQNKAQFMELVSNGVRL